MKIDKKLKAIDMYDKIFSSYPRLNNSKKSVSAVAKDNKEINKKEDNIIVEYKENERRATLKIKGKEPVVFKKKTALILYYLYEAYTHSDKDYKSYHDFNSYSNELIESDRFNKDTKSINKRVEKEIGIQKIIAKKDSKTPKEITRVKLQLKF